MKTSIYVDDRIKGNHGIARYGQEVLRRLTVPRTRAGLPHHPASALDLVTPRFRRTPNLLYTPGYNAGPGTLIQLVTVHDLIHLTSPSLQHALYYERILKPAIRRAGVVFTVSEASQSALDEWLGDSSIRIVDTGNGVSPAFRKIAGLEAVTGPFVLYVGNFKPHKNTDVIFSAMKKVTGLKLIVVGPDPDDTAAHANKWGVTSRVTGLSRLTDLQLAELYNRATATILPSLVEGFGLPAAESLACGTPVIYWEGCRSVAEIVGHRGIAVSSPDSDSEWAEALIAALEGNLPPTNQAHPDTYSWDAVAKTVDTVLSEIAHA